MDELDLILVESTVNTDVEIPKSPPKNTQPRGEGRQTSSSRVDPTTKPKATSSAAKDAERKKKKRKEQEKSPSKVASPKGRQGPSEADNRSADKGRGAGLNLDKKQKSVQAPSEELLEADFAAVAKVAKLGVEAIKKMKAAVLVNTPGNLEELLRENRQLQEDCDKNADLLKRLVAAEHQADENTKKAANLDKVSEELQITREDLARLRKEAEDAEIKAKARLAELEKKCQSLKNSNAEMAKFGYAQCLSQVLVIEPNLPTQYMHLTKRVVDGKILSKDGTVEAA